MKATAERPKSEMAQMNTRIDRRLKERGDAALARAGFTPSQAVRALWEFAAEHEYEPEAIEQALSPNQSQNVKRDETIAVKLQDLEDIQKACSELLKNIKQRTGMTSLPLETLPCKELRDLAYERRIKEWEHACQS